MLWDSDCMYWTNETLYSGAVESIIRVFPPPPQEFHRYSDGCVFSNVAHFHMLSKGRNRSSVLPKLF